MSPAHPSSILGPYSQYWQVITVNFYELLCGVENSTWPLQSLEKILRIVLIKYLLILESHTATTSSQKKKSKHVQCVQTWSASWVVAHYENQISNDATSLVVIIISNGKVNNECEWIFKTGQFYKIFIS